MKHVLERTISENVFTSEDYNIASLLLFFSVLTLSVYHTTLKFSGFTDTSYCKHFVIWHGTRRCFFWTCNRNILESWNMKPQGHKTISLYYSIHIGIWCECSNTLKQILIDYFMKTWTIRRYYFDWGFSVLFPQL
jgi:hypothetical protein